MKTIRYLDRKTSLKRAVKAIYRELGPVEMMRVTSLAQKMPGDSVSRHRKLQASLDDEQVFKEVMAAYRKR